MNTAGHPTSRSSVEVSLTGHSYTVEVGPGVRRLLPDVVAALGATRVVMVSARPPDWTPSPGVPCRVVQARDGEHDKSLDTVAYLCQQFAEFRLSSQDAVISCGGGTTTDVAGLAAALYHRGVPVVHIPTTLLAQVDASIGGKTAVNLAEGKNLIGCYWQPSAVLCDTEYLQTLPRRELVNGFGELARCHFIGAPNLHELPLFDQIVTSVSLKASIVAAAEHHPDLRHILNYGHTLGHALELATDFTLRHGEAVAIGTVFAGHLAQELGRIDAARQTEHLSVVRGYGLPIALPAGVTAARLVGLMRMDKKAAGDELAFVLDGRDGAEIVRGIPEAAVLRALAAMPRTDS